MRDSGSNLSLRLGSQGLVGDETWLGIRCTLGVTAEQMRKKLSKNLDDRVRIHSAEVTSVHLWLIDAKWMDLTGLSQR